MKSTNGLGPSGMGTRESRSISILPIVAGLVLVALIIGIIFFTVGRGNTEEDAKSTTSETSQKLPEADDVGPKVPAGYAKYASPEGLYTLYYPEEWVEAEDPDACTEGLLLLGVEYDHLQNTVGKCGTEFGGQILFSSTEGDLRDQYPTSGSMYSSPVRSATTVNGVQGTKFSAAYTGAGTSEAPLTMPDGTRLVRYVFFAGGRTYIAQYQQQPDWPDALADFNTVVTNHWKFPVTE